MKNTIRKEVKNIRSALSDAEVSRLSRMICFRLANSFYLYDKTIALYYPINNEVDVMYLKKYSFDSLCLPLVENDEIVFKLWKSGDIMSVSSHHILEPLPTTPTVMPDIAIVPLLAFDDNCYRIGYGGGFYDKFLEYFDGISIGVAFEVQKVRKIKAEAHDIPLDYIVTESKVYEYR